MSSWLVLFLGENPEWKAKALAEVRRFVDTYADKDGGHGESSLSSKLAQIPPKVWEDEMPVLDDCLRETIRIAMTGTMLRRVVKDTDPNMSVEGHQLKRGTFLAYHLASAHHNPDIYPDPFK